jgi:hypothetical protein
VDAAAALGASVKVLAGHVTERAAVAAFHSLHLLPETTQGRDGFHWRASAADERAACRPASAALVVSFSHIRHALGGSLGTPSSEYFSGGGTVHGLHFNYRLEQPVPVTLCLSCAVSASHRH